MTLPEGEESLVRVLWGLTALCQEPRGCRRPSPSGGWGAGRPAPPPLLWAGRSLVLPGKSSDPAWLPELCPTSAHRGVGAMPGVPSTASGRWAGLELRWRCGASPGMEAALVAAALW